MAGSHRSDPASQQRKRRRVDGSRASSASTWDTAAEPHSGAAAVLSHAPSPALQDVVAADDVAGIAGSTTDGGAGLAVDGSCILVCPCCRPLPNSSGSKEVCGLDARCPLASPAAQTVFSLRQFRRPQTALTAASHLPLPPFLPVTEPVMSSTAQQHTSDASQLALLLHHARMVQLGLQLLAEGALRNMRFPLS